MTEGPRSEDRLSSAEAQLVRLLASLGSPGSGDPRLTRAVMRTARLQLAVRDLARAVTLVVGAVGEGAALLLRIGRRSG